MNTFKVLGAAALVAAGVILCPENADAAQFVYPHEGRVRGIGYFGAPRTGGRKHKGLDIAAPLGTPATAARHGKVTFAGRTDPGGFGTLVRVDHGAGYETQFAHMRTISVTTGQKIQTGTRVGLEGVEGNAKGTEPHLHFEIRRWGVAQLVPGAGHQVIHRGSPIPRHYPGLDDVSTPTPPPVTPPPPNPDNDVHVWKNQKTGNINVRSGPGTQYAILGQIKPGRAVAGYSSSGDWLSIHYKGKWAWINRPLLKDTGAKPIARVKANKTAFLAGASSGAKRVGEAHKGEAYPIVSQGGGFVRVDWGDIANAYLSATDVEIE